MQCGFVLDVQSVNEVVKRSRLRWFGHVEHKSGLWKCGRGEMCG